MKITPKTTPLILSSRCTSEAAKQPDKTVQNNACEPASVEQFCEQSLQYTAMCFEQTNGHHNRREYSGQNYLGARKVAGVGVQGLRFGIDNQSMVGQQKNEVNSQNQGVQSAIAASEKPESPGQKAYANLMAILAAQQDKTIERPALVYRGIAGGPFSEANVLANMLSAKGAGLPSRLFTLHMKDIEAWNSSKPVDQRLPPSELADYAAAHTIPGIIDSIEQIGLAQYVRDQKMQTFVTQSHAVRHGSTAMAFADDVQLSADYAVFASKKAYWGEAATELHGHVWKPQFVVAAKGQCANMVPIDDEFICPSHLPVEQTLGLFVSYLGSNNWYCVNRVQDHVELFEVPETGPINSNSWSPRTDYGLPAAIITAEGTNSEGLSAEAIHLSEQIIAMLRAE